MKVQSYFLIAFVSLFLWSCGSKKTVVKSNRKTTSKSRAAQKKEAAYYNKLPSVNQNSHVKKLKKKKSDLNKHTLAYIKKYAPLAVVKMHEYKIPASITLAQGILESGNGRSTLASKSNNHFGIKCHKGWKGKRVYHDDDKKDDCFRKYKYTYESYNDHSKFLTTRRRYAFLFKLKITDYKGWSRGLKKAGYATDRRYANKLIDFIKKYKLYEFDKVSKRDLRKFKRKLPEKEVEVVVATPKKITIKIHVVKKGDTLYSIAKRNGTTVKTLKKNNNLKGNTLSIGQKLIIK